MKIGNSLSLCVESMLKGEVNIEDVVLIHTSTAARNEHEFEEVLEYYCKNRIVWQNNQTEAKKIGQELWDSGRIDQPRLRGEETCSFPVWEES